MKTRLGLTIAASSVVAMAVPAPAQQPKVELPRWGKEMIRPLTRPNVPSLGICDARPVPGGTGADGIIGEKGRTDGVIGEKRNGNGIIGEKREAVIGEKREVGAQVFAEAWESDRFTTFKHVIEGTPGRVKLTLDACTSASGGETVAVYPVDAQGVRKTPRILFVIATRNGNARAGSLVLPKPPRGQTTSKLPVMVVVENASGRPHTGEYRLTVTR